MIERNSTGEVTGTVHFDNDNDERGPFPPAMDPDVGYPPDVDRSQYLDLSIHPVAGVSYRIYGASFSDRHFMFHWSSLEPWDQWCRLQTSYPWQVGDHQLYFCVPQDETASAQVDLDKLALCTDPDICIPEGSSGPDPCACDGTPYNPLCGEAYCQCDDRGCRAAIYAYLSDLQDFVVDGTRMSGSWGYGGERFAVTFQRHEP